MLIGLELLLRENDKHCTFVDRSQLVQTPRYENNFIRGCTQRRNKNATLRCICNHGVMHLEKDIQVNDCLRMLVIDGFSVLSAANDKANDDVPVSHAWNRTLSHEVPKLTIFSRIK